MHVTAGGIKSKTGRAAASEAMSSCAASFGTFCRGGFHEVHYLGLRHPRNATERPPSACREIYILTGRVCNFSADTKPLIAAESR